MKPGLTCLLSRWLRRLGRGSDPLPSNPTLPVQRGGGQGPGQASIVSPIYWVITKSSEFSIEMLIFTAHWV